MSDRTWYRISPEIDYPHTMQLYRMDMDGARDPVTAASAGKEDIYIRRDYFDCGYDMVEQGNIYTLASYRVIVVSVNEYDNAICRLIQRGQRLRALFIRIRIRVSNIRYKLAITWQIWHYEKRNAREKAEITIRTLIGKR